MNKTSKTLEDQPHSKDEPKNLPKKKDEHTQLPNASTKEDSKLCSVLQSLEKILASYVQSNQPKPTQTQNTCLHSESTRGFEPRDRFVTLDLPDLPEKDNQQNSQTSEIRQREIEAWVGKVCKTSISIGFNHFMEKKVDESQMKAFVCEKFVRNLVLLVEKCKITAKELEKIDELLKEEVLPYSKAKYPLSSENEVNKALKNKVKTMDNSQMLENDYVYSSDVSFEYRQNQHYEDLIMKFVNQIMKKCNQKMEKTSSDQIGITHYKDFEKLMEDTFKLSYRKVWMGLSSTEKDSMKIAVKEANKKDTLAIKEKLQRAEEEKAKIAAKEAEILNIKEEEIIKVQCMGFTVNNLEEIPESIDQLQSIKEFNVSNNKHTKIPQSIDQLPFLSQSYQPQIQRKKLKNLTSFFKTMIQIDLIQVSEEVKGPMIEELSTSFNLLFYEFD